MKQLKEIKSDLFNIVAENPEEDWELVHSRIVNYLKETGLKPTEHLNAEVSNHFLNALKISDYRSNDFLYGYTEYFDKNQNSLDNRNPIGFNYLKNKEENN